jgi:hypothetical protein
MNFRETSLSSKHTNSCFLNGSIFPSEGENVGNYCEITKKLPIPHFSIYRLSKNDEELDDFPSPTGETPFTEYQSNDELIKKWGINF